MTSDFIKLQMVEIGKKLGERGFSPATSGNISVRHGDVIYVTATKTCLWELETEDIVEVNIEGALLAKESKAPSSEALMHLHIYKKRADINAVIHCHPPKTSAFAVCGKDLDAPVLTESLLYFNKIPVAKYGLPSSVELAHNTVKHFLEYDVVIMANHGLVVGADTLKNAFYKVENAESYAEIYLNSLILGKPKKLSPSQIKEILALKK